MRIAFTIIYNGYHHLTHKDFIKNMLSMFDYWVVIEGLSAPGGSTSWCKNVNLPARSNDGTHELLMQTASKNQRLIYYSSGVKWTSKDAMVNKAVDIIRSFTNACYLWQVDCDEIWRPEDLTTAEISLKEKAGGFKFNHFLCMTDDGRQLIARGDWGSGYHTRIWNWEGERFLMHEPPRLYGQRNVQAMHETYDHYSYYFIEDIIFKSKYYSGYEDLPARWYELKSYTGNLPLPITRLFGERYKKWKRSKSLIEEYIPELKLQTA